MRQVIFNLNTKGVMATFGIPEAILASATPGFPGLGVQPPTPEWGVMFGEGRDLIRRAPHHLARRRYHDRGDEL